MTSKDNKKKIWKVARDVLAGIATAYVLAFGIKYGAYQTVAYYTNHSEGKAVAEVEGTTYRYLEEVNGKELLIERKVFPIFEGNENIIVSEDKGDGLILKRFENGKLWLKEGKKLTPEEARKYSVIINRLDKKLRDKGLIVKTITFKKTKEKTRDWEGIREITITTDKK